MTTGFQIDYGRLRPVRPDLRLPTLRAVAALTLREMTTTYGRSPGGYVWVILEPIGGIVLLALAFSLLLRAPPLGTNFLLFYATGLLPFQAFMTISGTLASSLTYSRQLLVYPRITFVDALLARFLLNTLTALLTSALVLTGILLIYTTQAAIDLPAILLGYAMAAALGGGIGTLNCFLTTRFTIWRSVWAVIMRPMVLLSGVMFTLETIPQPFRDWLWYNPLIHVTGEMRSGFYFSYAADYVSATYVFGIALSTGLVGLLFLRRYHRDILEL